MDDLGRLLVRSACTDVITRYAIAVNAWDLDAFVALFTEDAVWQRPGEAPLRGHEEIRRFMESQPTAQERVVRHVNGGILVDVVDEDHAEAWSQTTVYDTRPVTPLPAVMLGPDLVVEYRDQFVRGPGGWRIARRDTTVVFRANP